MLLLSREEVRLRRQILHYTVIVQFKSLDSNVIVSLCQYKSQLSLLFCDAYLDSFLKL